MSKVNIAGVRKSYGGKQVVHGLDLAFEDGEFVVIVGPSGCGKSTLLRMIAGLEDITEGEISVGGEIVNDLDPSERGCAMVFQNYALYPHMSVVENIAYPLKIARLPKAERLRRANEVASLLGLTDFLNRRPGQLSGGQRQRVAMGRAIVREPELFLFDEPLSNLDAKLRVKMRIEIRRLHKRLNATSIFVTHDQIEAMTLADRLVVMNNGLVEQVGRPADIYANPETTFVADFLGAPAMNLCPAHVHREGAVTLDAVPGEELSVPAGIGTVGRDVIIGIRPENIAIAGPEASGLPGAVDLVEELGGARVAYCRANEVELAVVVHGETPVKEGDQVVLQLDTSYIHLFDRSTGHRIRQETEFAAVAAQ